MIHMLAAISNFRKYSPDAFDWCLMFPLALPASFIEYLHNRIYFILFYLCALL
jgi:hypothetical protein